MPFSQSSSHDTADTKPADPPVLTDTIKVNSEDDIIGQPASNAYHVCLEQLVEYLLLPVLLCTVYDPLTSVECLALGPFKIQCRGTGFIIQWVC